MNQMNHVPDNKQISVGTRIGAMLLDHLFMTMIAMVFFIPGMISIFADAFIADRQLRTIPRAKRKNIRYHTK